MPEGEAALRPTAALPFTDYKSSRPGPVTALLRFAFSASKMGIKLVPFSWVLLRNNKEISKIPGCQMPSMKGSPFDYY